MLAVDSGLPRASTGDVDYAVAGAGYAERRRTDPQIARLVHAALGDARTVLNVGAGAGSYEPDDRYVIAIEPSAAMRAQRPPGRVPAIHAIAESLPLDDASVDAAMATTTVHQWGDLAAGIGELRRVTRGPIVILAFDPDVIDEFWLADYAPELMALERPRNPAMSTLVDLLGGAEVSVVPIPHDCTDGFTEAFYARPEALLDDGVRRSQSAWTFVEPAAQQRSMDSLRRDLASGKWDERYGPLRTQPFYEGSLRLIVGRGRGRAE
jgi:hypothetical protein